MSLENTNPGDRGGEGGGDVDGMKMKGETDDAANRTNHTTKNHTNDGKNRHHHHHNYYMSDVNNNTNNQCKAQQQSTFGGAHDDYGNNNNHNNSNNHNQADMDNASLWSGRTSDELAAMQAPTSGMGSIPLQPGESMYDFERPTSAPPPPGFSSGPEERNRLAEELLWGTTSSKFLNSAAHGGVGGGGHGGGFAHQYHPHPLRSSSHASQSTDDSTSPHQEGKNSFITLAAVLGAGLAESMEDATNEKLSPHGTSSAGNLLTPNPHPHASSSPSSGLAPTAAVFHPKDDLNFHRQTRHAASRLIGSTAAAAVAQNQYYANANANTTKNHNSNNNNNNNDPNNNMLLGHDAVSGLFGSSNNNHTLNNGSHDESGAAYSRAPGASPMGGFPTSLSTPQRKKAQELAEKRDALRGSTTPIQLVPGQHIGERRNLPLTKDIGTKVVEPESDNQFQGLSGIVSKRLDNKNPWSLDAPEFKPQQQQDYDDGNSSMSDSVGGVTDVTPRQAETELRHFLWDIDRNQPSRTLALLHLSWLRAPDVRSACETYGVVESFRADFATKGIYFCSYYDIRSAQYAAVELQSVLQRMLLLQRSSEEVVVRYCLPLNSSGQFDESQILISELPPEVDENLLNIMLSSYGAIRSVFSHGPNSFCVEFQNVQDAKQALLELESSQPWGPDVSVEMGVRNPVERKRGRELLSMIGRWRHGMNRQGSSPNQPTTTGTENNSKPSANSIMAQLQQQQQQQQKQQFNSVSASDPWRMDASHQNTQTPVMLTPLDVSAFGAYGGVGGGGGLGMSGGGMGRPMSNSQPQVVLGPDGRYQIVMQNPSTPQFSVMEQQPRQQQIIQGPNGQLYVAAVPMQHNMYVPETSNFRSAGQGSFPGSINMSNGPFGDQRRVAPTNTPYYAHVIASDASTVSGRSYRSLQSAGAEEKDTRHLTLDLDAVENGRDTRTSLMVRNIPNKYTQQMLLAEFEEFGHGPGVIDFFYLPIDFKNRCNRGYAFINFVDCKDILAFHRRYFGKHWRTFNSDKICDITYARIQGKAAMLKRFENSALMEKDDEYKPLVFASSGPNKGQRLPFPGIGVAGAIGGAGTVVGGGGVVGAAMARPGP